MEWDREQVVDFLRLNWLTVVLGLAGMLFLLVGWKQQAVSAPEVEVIEEADEGQAALVTVDVAGAVVRPGVYRVPEDFRIGALLEMAGGTASGASQTYVSQVLNQAQPVNDGMKLFIPFAGDEQAEKPGGDFGVRVNVNTASKDELDRLPGIGPARAESIIKNRPYHSLEELAEKSKTPVSILEQSSDKIIF